MLFQLNSNLWINYFSSGNEESRCKKISPSNTHFVTWYQTFKDVSKVPDDVHAATLDELYHKVRIELYHSSNHMILLINQLQIKQSCISNRPYHNHSHINAEFKSRSVENGPQILNLRNCWVGAKHKEIVKLGLKLTALKRYVLITCIPQLNLIHAWYIHLVLQMIGLLKI